MRGAHPQTAALLSDALGALAVFATNPHDAKDKTPKLKVDLGRADGWASASAIRLAPNGAVVGFSFQGDWTIDRTAPSYLVMGMRRDATISIAKP